MRLIPEPSRPIRPVTAHDHRYAALLPAWVERTLTTRPAGPPTPWSRQLDGTVLVADVVGFTALAESHADRGSAGAERLSTLLSICFGRLADEIEAFGGDVIGFAGDAPLAVYEAGHADALERAVAAARRIQAAMPAISTEAARDLSVRIAITTGRLTALGVGGTGNRWQWLAGGPPIARLRTTLSCAAPGEIAVDGTVIAGSGSRDADSSWRLVRDYANPADCRRFVSQSVASRLDAGQEDWAAELRRVTTLFVTIRGWSYEQPEALAQTQALVTALQRAVYDADGSINQLIADDKGTTLVAGWGLPGTAHDDDATRATEAAAAIHATLAQTGVDYGAGLATGRVFCGWRGNARRREYALIGSVVNLAARLAGAATREVLADDATRKSASRYGGFVDAGPYTLKGRGIVHAARVTPDRRSPSMEIGPTVVVGRLAERQQLATAINRALDGQGGTLFVQGDAGAGKSTLVMEAVARARATAASVLVGAGTAVNRGTGHAAWRPVLESLIGVAPGADQAARLHALERALAGHASLGDRMPLLGPILEVPIDDTTTTASMTAPLRAAGARELLLHLVEAELARRPVVLVFEDAHWLDSLSWSALAAAARRLPQLLVIAGLRPMTEPPAEWGAMLGRPDVTVIDVGRLEADDAMALAGSVLGVARVPDALRALILDKCGGHPLFVTEFARWLVETGAVLTDGDACRYIEHHGAQADLPASVEGVILHRLDRVSTSLQLTLRVASVLGAGFTRDALEALHPLQPTGETLDAELLEAERLGFVQRDGSGFTFTHVLFRDATYQLTPHSQRVSLHRALADRLMTAPPEARSQAILAFHREGAEQYDEAVTHLGDAGHGAWSQGAVRETIRFLEHALALAERERVDVPALRRAGWHRLTGQAQVLGGDIAGSHRHLADAFALLGASFPATPAATKRRLLGEAARQAVHLVLPRRRLRTPSEVERTRTTETIRTLRAVSEAAYFETDHLTYMTAGLAAINRAEKIGVQVEAATGYASAAYTASLLKLRPLARRWWRLAGRPDDAEARLNLLTLQALVALQEARWADFGPLVDDLVSTSTRVGAIQYLDGGLVSRLLGEFHQGRLGDSLSTARALLESASAQFNEQHQIWAQQAISSFLRWQGDIAGAERHTAEAIALLPAISDPLTIAQHYAHRLEAANSAGDLNAAATLAAEVDARIRATPPATVSTLAPFHELTRYGIAAWTHEADGHGGPVGGRAAASPVARQARWASAQLGRYAFLFPYARPYHATLKGQIDWLSGRHRAAARRWRGAVRLAQRTGMPQAEADALVCLGRFTAAGTSEGERHLSNAATIYRRIGIASAGLSTSQPPPGRDQHH